MSQFFFLLRTLFLYKFPPAAVYKTKVGGGGRLFLTRRPLTSTCAVLSIRKDKAHKPHISFPSCTVAPLSCLFLPTQHTPFIFDSYPSIDLPALFHRLPCPPLLHLDDHHMVVEGVLKGRGRRVWCGIPWQRARWGKLFRKTRDKQIIESSSRHLHDLQASCIVSSHPPFNHISLPRIISHSCQTRCTRIIIRHRQLHIFPVVSVAAFFCSVVVYSCVDNNIITLDGITFIITREGM